MEAVWSLGQEQSQDKLQKPNCSGSRKKTGGEEVVTVSTDNCPRSSALKPVSTLVGMSQ